jgi:hypothetical protein
MLVARLRSYVIRSVLVAAAVLAAYAVPDFGVSDDAAKARLRTQGVYHPRSIADAIVHTMDMNTFLYHEGRCGHIDGADADRLRRLVMLGVKQDFPGWGPIDDAVIWWRMWLQRRRVEDLTCAESTVPNPNYVTQNINFYAARP